MSSEEVEEAEYVGPASYTNREILKIITEEIALDGALDEQADVAQILDMGGLHDGSFSRVYMLLIEDDVRVMREQEAIEESLAQGEHLSLVKD